MERTLELVIVSLSTIVNWSYLYVFIYSSTYEVDIYIIFMITQVNGIGAGDWK